MPPKPRLNPRNFPRPPALERISRHIQIKWEGHIIADTKDAYWVLETFHPPTYYLPPSSLTLNPNITLTPSPTKQSTFCEWKGRAKYHDLIFTPNPSSSSTPSSSSDHPTTPSPSKTSIATSKIWSYPSPTPSFSAIKDYLSFYAGTGTGTGTGIKEVGADNIPWECFVDGELVRAQPGDFYGGWITDEIIVEGNVKGGKGTWGW
ncbi:hypothetical protein MMC09_000456 [Bachmanniomyces sp. S44760]|nr:hypothetical protein [Bachmanniomyces sp. S44760]